MAIGKSDVYLKLNVVKKVMGVICVVLSLPFGVEIFAASEIIVGITAVTTNITANKKLLGYTGWELWNDIKKSLIFSLIMAGSIIMLDYYISSMISSYLVKMLIEIVVGGMIYVTSSYLTHSSEFMYILNIFKKKKV